MLVKSDKTLWLRLRTGYITEAHWGFQIVLLPNCIYYFQIVLHCMLRKPIGAVRYGGR